MSLKNEKYIKKTCAILKKMLIPVPWALRVIAEKPRKLYCAAFHCDWYALSVIYNARVYIWRQSSIDSFT